MKFAKELEQELVPGKLCPAAPASKLYLCQAYIMSLPQS